MESELYIIPCVTSLNKTDVSKEYKKHYHYHENNNLYLNNSSIHCGKPLKQSVSLQFPVECNKKVLPSPEYSKNLCPNSETIFHASSTDSKNFSKPSSNPDKINYIITPNLISPSNTPDFSQRPSRNQKECFPWLNENHWEEESPNKVDAKRPWWVWFIGIVDILSALWYTALVANDIFTKEVPDSDAWKVAWYVLGIMLKLSMGASLLVGLKNKKNSICLWCSKLWVICQLVLIASSAFEVIAGVLMYATPRTTPKLEELPPAILTVLAVFVYRVFTFIMVRLFVEKMKRIHFIEHGENASERGEGVQQLSQNQRSGE